MGVGESLRAHPFVMYNNYMKRVIVAFLGFLLLYGIFYFFGDTLRQYFVTAENESIIQDFDPSEGVVIDIADATVHAELALTNDTQKIGLSGRSELPQDTGMLFVYDHPDMYAFWMPDMHFALDIIWLDANMMVVDVSRNVTPESFPDKFTPRIPAQFVLEVAAGYAQEKGIVIGTQAVVHQ